MNRIYRSIWNQATGAYAAVSENVKSAGKRSMPGCSGGGAHFALTSMAAALMLGYGSLALAGPAGGTVVAGQASITGAPGSTVIRQGSQNAVINWANFNINKGESVQFVQPNSNAVALNRVLGSDGTTILGNLSANGKVFIVNPNGVLFGQGASVNTAGLLASTLDINNADFMAGKYQFAGNGTGKVLNQGAISAPGGYVALLGANVSNEGTIQARLGSVALAAGRAITLDVAGDGLLNVAVNAGAVGALVSNGGMIKADGGSVLLSAQAAGDLLKTVVNNTGVIEAQTIDTRSGTIKLLGDMQSGTVNAGGTLDASAPGGGNGGFVDTSAAHVKIDDALKVTTAAPKGLAGTWLIDPTDFNIAVSGGDMTGAFLSNSLKSGNVQIQSVSGGSGTQGNINVNDNINWIANKLTLTAQNNININRAMRGAGTASLALEYGQSGVAAGNLSTYNVKAEVDLPSGNNFSTKLGSDGGVTVYQVINSLGAFNSSSGSDVQGMQANLSGNYVLGSNIDARATGSWESGKGFMPIGNDTTPFTGTLDGLGHELYGLTINRAETPAAMFGNIGLAGSVHNLSLRNVNITGSQAMYGAAYTDIGALAGYNAGTINNVSSSGAVHGSGYINMGALVGTNAGTISNSRAAGTVVAGAFGAAGGLVGVNAAGGLIKNSSSAVAATSTNYFAGGLAVYNRGTISDSYATGAVSVGGTGGSYGGGLAAINTGEGTVTNSYATGNVTGTSGLGGLLGRIESGAVTNSYATGNVTGSGNNIGGLVGASSGVISNSYATGNVTGNSTVGGVVGSNPSGSITNVYYSGKLTTTGINNGAIVGDHNGGSIVNAYFDSSINPGLTAVGVVGNGASTIAQGLTSAQMLQGSNFAGFNFTTTAGAAGNNWVIVSGDGSINGASAGTRPMLASEWSNTINSTHQLQLMAMSKAASYTLDSSFSAASTAANGNDVWGSTGFIPVGTAGSAFTGSLDGSGHTVSNLNIIKSGVAGVGLFGVVGSGGVIANVGLSGGTISGGDNTGALVGTNGGSVSGSFATSAVTGANNVGGLVGTSTGTLKDSYASGAVTGSSGTGGLLGSNSGTVTTSYANGSVSGAGGGLVGTGAGSVMGSYWDSTASGKATSAGGTSVTTSGLNTLSNYTGAGWDLDQMWVAYDGQSAPFLRSFMQQIAVRVSYGSKVYDGVAYAGGSNSVTYSNTVAGASLLGTVAYAGNAAGAVNAGTYGVMASGLYSSGGQSGYAISYIDGGLVITQRQLSLNGASAGNKVYDGNTTAIISGGTLAGLVAGDLGNVNLLSLLGTYASKNVGNGIAVNATATLGGSAAGNYILAPLTGVSGNITPATISSISGILAGSKVYDGLTDAALDTSAAVLAGKIGSDALTLSGTGTFDNKNAGTGKTVSISGLFLGGADAGNYTLADTTGSALADITAKALTITDVTTSNRVYDGTRNAALSGGTLSGLVGGETLGLSGLSGVFDDKSVGTGKSVTVSGATLADGTGLASNYTVSNPGALTADISKATISSVTNITANSKVYDANTKATINAGGATFNGMFSGDSLSFSATTAAFADKDVGSGKTVAVSGIALAGTDAGNYNLTLSTGSGSGDITPKALTITGMSAVNKVYDGNTKASLSGGSISGLVGSETLGVTGLVATFDDKNAGTGKTVIASGSTLVNGGNGGLASNYTISNPSELSANITPKALTVTGMTASNKVYDGLLDATLSGGSLSGLVSGETLLLSGATGVFSDKNAGSNKTIVVSGSSLADGTGLASNYTVSNPTTVKAGITQKALTVSGVLASDKTYDGNTKASLSGGTLDGLVGGETLGLTGQVGSFSDQNAGMGKAVAVTGATLVDGTGLASNYTVSNATGVTATIAQKALTVSGVSASNRVYDGTLDAVLSGGVLSGLVGMETLSLNLANQAGAFSDKNAGSNKVVNVTGATVTDGTGLASNYAFSNASGVTATITPKALTVTGVTAASRDYDGTQQAALSGGVLSGLVGMETLSLNLANQTGALSDKNAGSNKVVNVTGATVTDGTGLASNYAFSNASGVTATITPKALTVTGVTAASRDYDGTQQAALSGGVLSGLVGMETLSLNLANQTGVFSDKNAGSNKVVNVTGATVTDGTGLVSNYAFSNASGVRADIGKASISAIAGIVAANKVYDGGTAASLNLAGATFNGLVAGDVLSLGSSPVLGAFSDKNAAPGKTVVISGLGLAGADAGNYVLASSVASTTATITPATLTVSASGINKVYDATTNATVSLRDNRIGNDQLSIASNGASFSDKNAGVGKTVTVAGIRLSGTDAGNYVVNSSASTTASISQAALTVKVDNAEKDQGRANPDFSAGYSGLLGGDTVAAEVSGNLAFSTPATTASAAGNYLVSASGQASNNYALNYVEGVLKVKPTEALQSAVASVIAAVAVAPSQGNMVQADMIVSGETAPSKPATTQEAPREGETGNAGSAPVVQLASNVVSNILPGLRLNVIDSGLRLPTEAGGNTRQDSQ